MLCNRYLAHKCLVTNFTPTASVKQAMNNTFVQALQKQVDAEVAETRKIVRRCESEAEATTKALQGQGVSLMRRAYVNGMQVCVVDAVKRSHLLECLGRELICLRTYSSLLCPPTVQKCMDEFVESMSGDNFLLTQSDVLYMQLLLQHFDSLSDLTKTAIASGASSPKLFLDCDPKSVAEMRKALDVGHVRTAADGPKRAHL